MKYADVAALDPRIHAIMTDIKPARRRSARWRQYERIKEALHPLVGWKAQNPELSSSTAYETEIGELARRLKI